MDDKATDVKRQPEEDESADRPGWPEVELEVGHIYRIRESGIDVEGVLRHVRVEGGGVRAYFEPIGLVLAWVGGELELETVEMVDGVT